MPYVYLLHFETPLKHAQHYLGSTKTLRDRMKKHRENPDPHIIKNGFKHTPFVVARTWKFGGIWNARKFESHLKRTYKNARKLCPLCKEEKRKHDREAQQARRSQRLSNGTHDVGVGGTATES
jgi:predicted GIY-YIG superfamily endonuclease